AKYFNKTECFCFTRQAFEPKGSKDMPLAFIIDEDLPINIDRITLSYTFFRSPDQS
ncbi:MAG: cytochrome c oxidase assembly protein subunit 11, partial [bacterium]